MCRRQGLLHMLSALVVFLTRVYGDDSACVVELVVQRRTHYSSPGSFLEIHCTVSYCIGGKPHMTWCKLHGEECLIVHEEPGRISTSWREEPATTHPWDFVLTFVSIQLKDTGAYRCKSEIWDRRNSMSRSAHVNVTDGYTKESPKHTNTTQEFKPTNISQTQVYVFVTLGILCLIAITLAFLWCIWRQRSRGKHKTSNNDLHTRTKGVVHSVPPSSSDVFTSTENVLYSTNNGSTIGLPQDQPEKTVYDNNPLPPRSTNPTGPTTTNHNSACNFNRTLPSNEGVLVYSAFNHSSTGGRNTRELSSSQGERTEYAVICVRK